MNLRKRIRITGSWPAKSVIYRLENPDVLGTSPKVPSTGRVFRETNHPLVGIGPVALYYSEYISGGG